MDVDTAREAFREILEQKALELNRMLRKRDDIAIEKSADQMDEIQYASERELAMRGADRDSLLLRAVKAALQRIRDGSFGTCVACDEAISPRRMAAVPWAPLCIRCQEAADRESLDDGELSESVREAA